CIASLRSARPSPRWKNRPEFRIIFSTALIPRVLQPQASTRGEREQCLAKFANAEICRLSSEGPGSIYGRCSKVFLPGQSGPKNCGNDCARSRMTRGPRICIAYLGGWTRLRRRKSTLTTYQKLFVLSKLVSPRVVQ